MNATCLRVEGRRLETKLSNGILATDEYRDYAIDAKRGSLMLRDAILLAKGIAPPAVKDEPRPFPLALPTEPQAELCPLCDAPFKPARKVVAHIQETVAAYYGLNPAHMISAERGRKIVRPRQVAMYLCREFTGKSLPDIGRRFGKRDHTTVLHAIRKVEELMHDDVDILLDVEVLRERLTA